MRKLKRDTTLLAVYCLGLLSALVPLAHGTDKKEIVRQARQSYYNLANAGMEEFQCQVLPDWDTTFKTLKTDPRWTGSGSPDLEENALRALSRPGRRINCIASVGVGTARRAGC